MNNRVISVPDAFAADANTIQGSLDTSIQIMEKAANSIADEAVKMFYDLNCTKVCILVGSGNNGGDAVFAANILLNNCINVELYLANYEDQINYTAGLKNAIAKYNGKISRMNDFHPELITENTILIDGIFGIGLNRPIEGLILQIIKAVNYNNNIHVLSIDIPSGICAQTGSVMGDAFISDITVTMNCLKRGIVLEPGSSFAGNVKVVDIGIHPFNYSDNIFLNDKCLWIDKLPFNIRCSSKYDNGHVAVLANNSIYSGAICLAAEASLRTGAGMVTIICNSKQSFNSNVKSVMFSCAPDPVAFMHERKVSVCVIGPGMKRDDNVINLIHDLVKKGIRCVIDAGAFRAIVQYLDLINELMHEYPDTIIFTPHLGEFRAVFDVHKSKIDTCLNAAIRVSATILLKGSDTIIAHPNGNIVINNNGSKFLATAGTGDVLSGMIAGFAVRGMSLFDAACAASWVHSEIGKKLGVGMIADDIISQIPLFRNDLEQGEINHNKISRLPIDIIDNYRSAS